MKWSSRNFSKILPQIIAAFFLAGFVAYAWTEPSSAPPAGNVDTPINVGPTTQIKQGDLTIGGVLKVEGNLLDNLGNIIYNATTRKIERARLPYQQGDITSDVDTNTYDGEYFNVSNLIPGNVREGVTFGRGGQVGTVVQMLNNEIGAWGQAFYDNSIGINGYCNTKSDCSGTSYYANFHGVSAIDGEYDPRNILTYTTAADKGGGCWSGSYGACSFRFFNPIPVWTCAPGWQTSISYGGPSFPYGYLSGCTNGGVCAFCLLSH